MPRNLPHPHHLRGPAGEQLPGSAEGSGSPNPHPRSVGHLGPSPRALTVAEATSGEAPATPLAPEHIILLTSPAGETAHEVPEKVNRAAA